MVLDSDRSLAVNTIVRVHARSDARADHNVGSPQGRLAVEPPQGRTPLQVDGLPAGTHLAIVGSDTDGRLLFELRATESPDRSTPVRITWSNGDTSTLDLHSLG